MPSLDVELLKTLASSKPSLRPCTKRQKEIWRLIALGKKTTEIAEALDVSVKTVEAHTAKLKQRTGCRNGSDLTRAAILAGLIKVTTTA